MDIRIEKLRARFFETIPEICSERARFFTQSMKLTEGENIAIRRAKGFANVLDNMTIFLSEGELIAGNQTSKPWASPIFPEYSTEWLKNDLNGIPYALDQRPADKFICSSEVKNELLEITGYWEGKTLFESYKKRLPEECTSAWNMGVIDNTWVIVAGLGNMLPDFELVIKQGLKSVINHARRKLEELDIAQPGEMKKYWFLQSVIIANEAVIRFSKRFADECLSLAYIEENPLRKDELLRMAKNCTNVPENPAQNFWEGIQSVWFILLMYYIESNGHSNSIGRFDQYLYPLYSSGIKDGSLTRKEALDLIEFFVVKMNSLNKLRCWDETQMMPNYHMAINLSVGGQTVDGKDAVNDLSYLCIEAYEEVKLFTSSISVKWFEGTEDRFLERALEAVQEHKGGMPAFYNDKSFIRTLTGMGVSYEDAVNWAPVGCIEASIPGKWDFAAKGGGLNITKVLEITLNNGKDPATGITLLKGKQKFADYKNIDELFEEFKRQLFYYMRLLVIMEHISDELHREGDINPFSSSLISDCIERGLSVIEGGSIYSADGGPTAGINTAGDSIAAIEYVVFDKKLITVEQLMHALNTDFGDMATVPSGEEIRQLLINKPPKFGNDDDTVDKWSIRIAEFIGSSFHREFKNSRYGKGPVSGCFSTNISPVTGNVAFARFIGATPDGRKAGQPVNNGISPCNGAEKNGATATVLSVSKMPTEWFQKGAILNMRLSDGILKYSSGRQRISSLIKVFFNKYGQQIQFNVVDNATLKDAQITPEKYKDLMVRVSGYSCLFTLLDRSCQNDLIGRTELKS